MFGKFGTNVFDFPPFQLEPDDDQLDRYWSNISFFTGQNQVNASPLAYNNCLIRRRNLPGWDFLLGFDIDPIDCDTDLMAADLRISIKADNSVWLRSISKRKILIRSRYLDYMQNTQRDEKLYLLLPGQAMKVFDCEVAVLMMVENRNRVSHYPIHPYSSISISVPRRSQQYNPEQWTFTELPQPNPELRTVLPVLVGIR